MFLFKAKNQGLQDKLSHLSLRLIKVNRRKITGVKKYICLLMPAASRIDQKRMTGVHWPVIAMVLAILAITGFQGYWLKNNY